MSLIGRFAFGRECAAAGLRTQPAPTTPAPAAHPIRPAAQDFLGRCLFRQVLQRGPAPNSGPYGKAVSQASSKPTLLLRGLDRDHRPAFDIVAPLAAPVKFATLTVTARYCYSTPPSETPETEAFVQIEDNRPEQAEARVFSGWMYASSPGLNGMQHRSTMCG